MSTEARVRALLAKIYTRRITPQERLVAQRKLAVIQAIRFAGRRS